MKGIILAGGSGTRLAPLTRSISKQILPVYNKPMIYYPLATLIRAGIKEILIISTPRDLPSIETLLGDGSKLGITLEYAEQPKPDGIAQAFIIGESFIGNESVCLILGDNIFHGSGLDQALEASTQLTDGAKIFAYHVRDPERYGVIAYDKDKKITDIIEKPTTPPSNWAVAGIYVYDNNVCNIAKSLKPSGRGELEITDLNRAYLEQGNLDVSFLGKGIAWLDAGTVDALLKASVFVQSVEERQALKIGCIEEAAYERQFITKSQLLENAEEYTNTEYGDYLTRLAHEA